MATMCLLDVRRNNAFDEYKKYQNQGFNINDVYYEFSEDRENNVTYLNINTPWMIGKSYNQSEKAKVYVETSRPPERGDDFTSFGEVEYFILKYFSDNNSLKNENGEMLLFDKKGNILNEMDCNSVIKQIALLANNLPHVHLWKEWISVKDKWTTEVKGDIDAETELYVNEYLATSEETLLKSNNLFIGKITDLRDIHFAYESIPEEYRKNIVIRDLNCTVDERIVELESM